MLNIKKSLDLWKRGESVIVRGTQTMSKSPNQYVRGVHPIYLQRGKGCEVQDLDGNWFVDYPCSLGPIILGHNHKRTVKAITRQLKKGITFSLISPLEVELAELVCDVVPCAEQIRIAKNGSDATSMAVRAARSYTGKDNILMPEGHYHGFSDFFAAVVRPYGVPKVLGELVTQFKYNDRHDLEDKLKTGKYGVVIMEPTSLERPFGDYLYWVKFLCEKYGAVLIFDEVVTGFRWALGGAQEYYGVTPHLTAMGKAMANGMPISIVAGKKEIMNEFDHVFFSSTFGGEACSIAAAIATVKELEEKRDEIYPHIWKFGDILRIGFNDAAARIGIDTDMFGMAPRHNIRFNTDDPSGCKDLFHQEMVKRGILIGTQIYVTWAHKEKHIVKTIDAMYDSLKIVAKADSEKDIDKYLEGERSAAIFKKSVSVGEEDE
jgi:glutamate-1-semialdehyde aminotransferase